MTEILHENSEYPGELLLGQIDDIVGHNPKVSALLSNAMLLTYSVGLTAPAEGTQPEEVLIASVRVEDQRLLTNVSVKATEAADDREYSIEPAGTVIKPLLGDASTVRLATLGELAGLSGLLESADFNQPEACKELKARVETPGKYALWHDAMVDPTRFTDS